MTAEIIGTWIAVAALGFSYIKDKMAQAQEMGRLEQKVVQLEKQTDKVDELSSQLNKANLHLAKLETKLDSLISIFQNRNNN
jgi:uncharacterized coiled-coil protein SlyX